MRIVTLLTALVLLGAPIIATSNAQSAPAQPAASAPPPCDGVYNIVRISEITPTGSIDKFMAAVAAHQAWYASHGFSDIVFAARVISRDPQTHAFSYSDTQMVTYHYSRPNNPPTTHDAAWDAYVKLYNETSTIKESYFQCVPAAGVPASLK
jgi:LPS sulfotransferase NodH